MLTRQERIRLALGEAPSELVLKNAKVVNVFTREIVEGDVAIQDGIIVGVGDYQGLREVDLEGRYLAPGFINAHCHVESSMASPQTYCREELRWGVTTLITDPHEIANVAGVDGIRFMLEASEGLPINYYVQLPSCVPATPFEHSGAVLTAQELAPLLEHPRVLGLGEMMNYPGVAGRDPQVMDKLALCENRVMDGHAPGLGGRGLQAYVGAGIVTDHESTTFEEAREKLRAGMGVLVREGSASKNLEAILTGVLREKLDTSRLAFCTDDKHLADIRREGTVRYNLKKAVELGMEPCEAIQLATINAAKIYGLKGLGAVAPGYRADLVVLEDLKDFQVVQVFKDGAEAHPEAVCLGVIGGLAENSVRIKPLKENAFTLEKRQVYPVIRLVPGQIITQREDWTPQQVERGLLDGTLRKLAVIERHHATGNLGVGLVAGYGLNHGAVATTVAHDSHNLIVLGDNDRDMLEAVREMERIGGGYTLTQDGQVVGSLPLPLGGLMSLEPLETLTAQLDAMLEKARGMGVAPGIDPFTTLSFVALPVIPQIRLTDMGLFDVDKFQFIV